MPDVWLFSFLLNEWIWKIQEKILSSIFDKNVNNKSSKNMVYRTAENIR